MDSSLIDGIVKIKSEFVKLYKNNYPLKEAIPVDSSNLFCIDKNELNYLHQFALSNPIYSNSFEMKILGIPCMVYEGDLNDYWINSIKHDTSYAPFYTTWIISSYVIALISKKLGYKQAIDVGSGDGRIAYCCKVSGMDSIAIEIDENLVKLQTEISSKTGVKFNAKCADAITFDYSSLNLTSPSFFMSGLPEMGEMLANSLLEKVLSIPKLKQSSSFVFMGTHLMRENSRDRTKWGWGQLMKKFHLDVLDMITLPTHWTLEQKIDTPFIFSKYAE